MKKLMMMVGVAVTMAMGTMAETTNTVKVTKFHQSYPYSGKATVEYTRSGGTWTDYHYSGVTWVSSTGQQMSSSPFASCPTDGKDNSALQSAGYIDSTGNLTAAHDAATAAEKAAMRFFKVMEEVQ